jgi:DNA repair protein REV1
MVEFERYKVVRPEWIVDSVKANKALPWNQYRLISNTAQTTIGSIQRPVEGYKAVSSRDEKVLYGGSGLRTEKVLSQESLSYPTPPEMKSVDIESLVSTVDNHAMVLSPTKSKTAFLEGRGFNKLKTDEGRLPMETMLSMAESAHEQSQPQTIAPSARSLPIINQSPRALDSEDRFDFDTNPISPPLNREVKAPFETAIKQEILLPPDDADDKVNALEAALVPSKRLREQSEAHGAIAAAHNATLLANPSLRSSTVLNPDFLKSYFDQSRLHHLSTWKADLKNQIQALAPSRPKKRNVAQPMIMHVDFDSFFCAVSLLSRPELKDQPVCVGHGGARSGEISSCNYPARKFGVRNGMTYFLCEID